MDWDSCPHPNDESDPLSFFSAEPDERDLRAKLREDIDDALDLAIGHSADRHEQLEAAMRYAVIGGGKRFRPMLLVAVCDLLGGAYSRAVRVGAAIECVHAQSLVHDDLPCMDDDGLRRGRPTLHRRFDEATAVLAGDALLALGFEILADERTHPDPSTRAELVLALARALGQDGLAGGQMMDLYPMAGAGADHMVACEMRKTGALIRYAAEAGAIISGCDAEDRGKLLNFAETLGLMFQVRDDLLDVTGDAMIVGKALGKDRRQGRNTATVCLGLDQAVRRAASLEIACHEALRGFGKRAAPLRELARFARSRTQ